MGRIYLASSWKNAEQPALVALLREAGHEVYDFRNPAPGNDGFDWLEMDRDWPTWSVERFAELLPSHPVAAAGFRLDKDALDWCDILVLALPCGRSAHMEAGYAAGQGKRVIVLLREERFEPELMYLLAERCVTSVEGLVAALREGEGLPAPAPTGPAGWPEPQRVDQAVLDELFEASGNTGVVVLAWWPLQAVDDWGDRTDEVIGGAWVQAEWMGMCWNEPGLISGHSSSYLDDDWEWADEPEFIMPPPPPPPGRAFEVNREVGDGHG